jgi:hypothetical protein
MGTNEIIKEIKKLSVTERLIVIEKTLKTVKLESFENPLKKAADLLYSDYMNDKELIAFTSLDFENFYETK